MLPEVVGVLGAYQRLALISTTLATYLRFLGYAARAHNLHDYQVLSIPVAVDAGVGELSRSGLIINREMGNCFKLATVTTDLPLAHDRPVDLKVREFCEECKICADLCPAGAIPRREPAGGARGKEMGHQRTKPVTAYGTRPAPTAASAWPSAPGPRNSTFSHELGRRIAVKGRLGARILLPLERTVYGEFKPARPPAWMEEPDSGRIESLRQ